MKEVIPTILSMAVVMVGSWILGFIAGKGCEKRRREREKELWRDYE